MTPELLITWTILLGALVTGWLTVRAVRDWRKQRVTPGPTPAEQLEQFQRLYEQGELSAAELERIRAALGTGEQPPPGSADAVRADRPAGQDRS